MKKRCRNLASRDYPNYGGRGISVCDRWRNSFDNFMADMGPKPSLEHSLDRINNSGNYEPSNCRWATRPDQNINKRSTFKVPFQGKLLPARLVEKQLGLPRRRIYDRIRKGWSMERAISAPSSNERCKTVVYFNGESLTVEQWNKRAGFTRGRIRQRLENGWTIEEAMNTPLRKHFSRPPAVPTP